MPPSFTITYIVIGGYLGAVVSAATRGKWTSGSKWSEVGQPVAVTMACAMLWPGMVILLFISHFPAGRAVLDRILFGPGARDNE
ncbi:hypothetical protein AOZ06_05290 [Kibdelosporangium phytohabitans]|uniref:Uncharacterized protein n=2 Tax=Kibdelosporangium phytohabitans TaxID=860235 RepID=A0A0N9HT73_9PSEU|nr:hypothetical protein AOZ06_05290 [Kibdelosporangium phytohabitans]